MSNTTKCSNEQETVWFRRITRRHDVFAWTGGIGFIGIMMCAIMLAGQSAGWNASSGHSHYNSTSAVRFSPEPTHCNETNVKGRHGERCYGRWYYWKLPVDKVTPLTRGIVWICYSCHQILFWIIIYIAQMQKTKIPEQSDKFGVKLAWYNWALLIGNAVFLLMHLGQTHWTYDGLAQDVTLASSEGSVIVVLALILVIEYKDRGMICMWPNKNSTDKLAKRIRFNNEPISVFRKYHGYLISWAMTYTFWYHPMENTWGHVLGFIHAGMIFLQGSLIYTRFHLNRYWRLLNETWVIVHGSFIALQTRSAEDRQFWPMYFLGFGFILSFTQIFGLKFWRNIHVGFRCIPPVLFLMIALIMCGTGVIRANSPEESSFLKLPEMFYIPLEMYLLMLGLWFLVYSMLKVESFLKIDTSDKKHTSTELTCTTNERSKASDNIDADNRQVENLENRRSHTKQACGVAGFLFIIGFMIFLSFIIQWTDVVLTGTTIMFILVAVFTICWSIAVMMTRLAFCSV